jgi:hypothetical protein
VEDDDLGGALADGQGERLSGVHQPPGPFLPAIRRVDRAFARQSSPGVIRRRRCYRLVMPSGELPGF